MGDRVTPTFGLALFENLDSELAAQGAGALQSDYSEASPEPGVAEPDDPTSRWAPYIRGAQSVALRTLTIRPGYVRADTSGASVAYRLGTDTAGSDYRGWSPPNLISRWTSPPADWPTASAKISNSAIAVNPDGVIVILRGGSGTGGSIRRYDPRTDTWANGYAWSDPLPLYRDLQYDPEIPTRLLLWAANGSAGSSDQITYYSDDDGDTWSLYAMGGWSATASGGSVSVGVAPGVEWLAATSADLWYSDTRGLSWTQTETVSSHGTAFQVLRVSGGWLVLYVADTTSYPSARLLPSARSSFADATEITIASAAVARVRGVVDHDGRVWVYTADSGSSTPPTNVYVTADGGASWTALRWEMQTVGSASGCGNFLVAPSMGSIWLACSGKSTGGTNPTTDVLQLLRLGGWDALESGPGMADFYRNNRDRAGWGAWNGGGSATGSIGTWLPYDEPISVGGNWTAVTAGAASTIDLLTYPALSITTGAGGANGHRYRRSGAAAYATGMGAAEVYLVAGAPNLGTAGAPLTKASIVHELSDGSYTYQLEIRIGADGVSAVDLVGTAERGRLALDGTARTEIRWHVTKGKCYVFARQPPEFTAWEAVVSGGTLTDGGASGVTTDRVTWGNGQLGSALTTSYWRLLAANGGGAWHGGIDTVATVTDTPDVRMTGLRFGRPLSPGGYPIPDATATTEAPGYLSAVGGPSYTGEGVDLPVQYRRGIHHTSPYQSPSPYAYWESTDGTADQEIVYDAGSGDERWRGHAFALVALRARIATALLQIDDGVGGWTTLGTLDLGTTVTYGLSGATLTCTAAGDTRWYREDELAGGWVAIPTGGAAAVEYREIVGNSAGYLDSAANRQLCRLRLGGVDGSEDSTGTVTIYHHSGVLVVYPTTTYVRRAMRVVVQDLGLDDTTTHRAGLLYPARVVGVGVEPGWDYSRMLGVEHSVERGSDGAPRVTRLGPSRETWTYGWEGGVGLRELRDSTLDPDYVAVSGGKPIGTQSDAWGIWDLIDHQLQSGQVPCVVIPQLPATTGTTITDPDLYLYGHATADAYGVTGVAGTEGVDEVVRVDGLTIEGYGR